MIVWNLGSFPQFSGGVGVDSMLITTMEYVRNHGSGFERFEILFYHQDVCLVVKQGALLPLPLLLRHDALMGGILTSDFVCAFALHDER